MREHKWCFFHDMPAHNEYEHRPNEMCDIAEGVMIRSDSVLYKIDFSTLPLIWKREFTDMLDKHFVQVWPEGDSK